MERDLHDAGEGAGHGEAHALPVQLLPGMAPWVYPAPPRFKPRARKVADPDLTPSLEELLATVPKTRRPVYPDSIVAKALALRAAGRSYGSIADALCVKMQTVRSWCNRQCRKTVQPADE